MKTICLETKINKIININNDYIAIEIDNYKKLEYIICDNDVVDYTIYLDKSFFYIIELKNLLYYQFYEADFILNVYVGTDNKIMLNDYKLNN